MSHNTTIKSTSLDFNTIKNNLKVFLANKPEFTDYNFESSALSNILDVLAWNTHYNALTANFALNESFLSTAQLRSSLVSLAQGIGYIPKSKTASRATIKASLNLQGVPNRPTNITLPVHTKFKVTIDNIVYDFYTLETLTATDSNGIYQFKTADGNDNITIYEGALKSKSFLVGPYDENSIYVIPDASMDTATAIIKVYENPTSSLYETYTNIINATVINDDTTLYILKESPNGYYELSFGDGITLGKSPDAGNKVVVEYLRTSGSIANNGKIFTAVNAVTIDAVNYNLSVSTVTLSTGGSEKEQAESIRKNAPFLYATQNRMVTAGDYASLILRNFGTLIKDVKCWGGEDDLEPRFGFVYISIVFNDGTTEEQKTIVKQGITDLANQLAIISFNIFFRDPIETYIETSVYFQFNPQLTTLSKNTIQTEVDTVVNQYFEDTIGSFGQGFRRSNLLTDVDEVSPAVLSSRAVVKMNQRIYPIPGISQEFVLRYPVEIAAPDDENYIVTSTTFTYQAKTCRIRNRLKSNKLEIISLSDNKILVDNIGEYNPVNNNITITGLNIDSFIGGVNYLKISATPGNQAAIEPNRNDILKFDSSVSFSSAEIYSSI